MSGRRIFAITEEGIVRASAPGPVPAEAPPLPCIARCREMPLRLQRPITRWRWRKPIACRQVDA